MKEEFPSAQLDVSFIKKRKTSEGLYRYDRLTLSSEGVVWRAAGVSKIIVNKFAIILNTSVLR